jgi:ATP-dependent RNA helicase DDX56/DBP9
MSSILDPIHTFTTLSEEVGLDYRLRKAIARLGHVRPTLVQSKCLPLAISSGRDLMVRAKTGSGKTLAYCLPMLQKILTKKSGASDIVGVSAVILVPTRELCSQVHQQIQQLTYYCDDVVTSTILSVGTARKGQKSEQELDRQEAMLRDRPDVIVATPNGLLTHIRSGALDLRASVETLIVDEADLVLSFGNSGDMVEIVKSLPRIYQGMLMSATLSPELESLKKVVLNSPVTLRLEQEERKGSGATLKQFFVMLPKADKNLVVYVFLKLGLLKGKGLFFVNSTDAGYKLKLFLEQFHIRAAVLNAELPFRSRLNIIEQFNLGNFDYLIATDSSADAGNVETGDDSSVDNDDEEDIKTTPRRRQSKNNDSDYGVSRGMDFQRVSFVVNFDIPPNPRSYAHRIGRTARGGAKGVALTFVNSNSIEESIILEAIQESQPKIPLAGASTDILQAAPTGLSEDSGYPVQPQPVPLDFDLNEIEGFRYRVEDVQRSVTKTAVRETRAAEIKAEILNSDRLQSHFEENPADLQILAHDRVATHVSRVQAHLKNVPKYLLPRGMQVANLNKKRKKKRNYNDRRNGDSKSRNDPLRNYAGDVNLDGVDGDENDPMADFLVDDDDDTPQKKQQKMDQPRIFTNTKDGTGYSTSGRSEWQQKHRKGQFSDRKKSSDKKYKSPLGI